MAVGRRCQLPDNKTLRGAPGCRKVQAVERTRVVTCAPAADCTARRRSRRLERPRSPRARLLRAREGDWEACGGDPCTRRPDVTVWSRWKVTTSRGARRLLCRPRVCQTAGVCVQSACLHLTPRCVLSRWRMYLFLIIVSGSVVRLLSSLNHSCVAVVAARTGQQLSYGAYDAHGGAGVGAFGAPLASGGGTAAFGASPERCVGGRVVLVEVSGFCARQACGHNNNPIRF